MTDARLLDLDGLVARIEAVAATEDRPRHAADVLGAAVDTGWWATQGYDPVAAIDELSDRLFHVHLKDVEAPGTHIACMHREGCAKIAACVEKLLEIGYSGPVSIEHHTFDLRRGFRTRFEAERSTLNGAA